MQFTNLIADDDAVSPVIGVILMVAITVILAAVIGTFVLGLGDQVSNTSPSASFTFDFDSSDTSTAGDFGGASSDGDGLLTVTHDGGDSISADTLSVSGSSASGFSSQTWASASNGIPASSDITAGDSTSLRAGNSDTIRVTWESSNGGDTATLGKWEGPNA